jgi:signal transduction histidine kinase
MQECLTEERQHLAHDVTEPKRVEQQLRQAYADLATREAELRRMMEALRGSHEELIQTQLQLIQAAKMETIGQLAAGVAHEVKNPLAVVQMGVDYLSEHLLRSASAPVDPTVRATLSAMATAVRRASAIVRGLVDFSAPGELTLEPQALGPIVEQSLLLLKHDLDAHHVRVVQRFAPDLPRVLLDRMKIEQVLLNLLMNAVHAMPAGGTLTVATSAQPVAQLEPILSGLPHAFAPDDMLVVAEIQDTGMGIPPEKLAHVFDPFFTTKPAGKGTGLGLAVVRQIIELHKAVIHVRNRSGPGESGESGVIVTLVFRPMEE